VCEKKSLTNRWYLETEFWAGDYKARAFMNEINAPIKKKKKKQTPGGSAASSAMYRQTQQPSMNEKLSLAPSPHTESEVLCFGLLNTTNVWCLSHSVMVFQYASRTEKDMCLSKRLA
jgi:hypothetical protein